MSLLGAHNKEICHLIQEWDALPNLPCCKVGGKYLQALLCRKDPIYYSEGLFDVDGDCFLVGTYIWAIDQQTTW